MASNHQYWMACKQRQMSLRKHVNFDDECKIDRHSQHMEKYSIYLKPNSYLSICKNLMGLNTTNLTC